ncbi:nucleotidyl transferase AbiEii/AbiGii toxin family protein [Neorhizobium sp. JUb45]|uniref:nucleotidyl transferase AbiEii/AbiGii toxin family protein n=1 Tax=unclassified Neorhizobium TaxID=2629175 RepID=UPI001045CCF5|nr:nucleotidyl transferase AbiEii/AbiGii toxin family protein [Neorhizobium sp. JUb45]
MIDSWSLGGGTALMLQIDHRESFDIDIFLDDPQQLPYLNPWTQGYELDVTPDAYVSDGARTLKVVFENIGEIDFICALPLTEAPAVAATVRDRTILLETPAEIIAKKICYRGALMQPRDMFDIACVIQVLGIEYVMAALRPFRRESEKALATARRMNPQFTQAIMAQLLYRNDFRDIPGQAQAVTVDLLERVCT